MAELAIIVCMAPFHMQIKVCIAPIHVRSKFADFAPNMAGSNADLAPYKERGHADCSAQDAPCAQFQFQGQKKDKNSLFCHDFLDF